MHSTQLRTAVATALALAALAPVVHAQDAPEAAPTLDEVVVTGSRIARPDYEANSPIATVTGEQLTGNADITLDTFLNTLPQVSPAGTTTSNNPGNNGQSYVDLRGLGSNRNLVLVDGRRPMVSTNNTVVTVDLNTIPQALVDGLEVITGGGGAVYGADAVAGVVNLRLKRDFEGVDLRVNYSNHAEEWDAREVQVSGVWGANFADDRGNFAIGFDYSDRQAMIKSQRAFAAVATSTTTFLPEGLYFPSGNAPTQAAVDAVFARYGVAAGAVAAAGNQIGFNTDGTLLSRGIFNTPQDVQNWRYPVDLAVNTNIFPDVYSYNFDAVNILTLPLERRSFLAKFDYEVGAGIETFGQIGWTEYSAVQALAPTPVPTVNLESPSGTVADRAKTPLIVAGQTVAGGLVVPVTNPFIPADFRELLASRTGDNAALVGSGATEPFVMRSRILSTGLRASNFENTVVQYMIGARGPIAGSWKWEAYAQEGRTEIERQQSGNIDTQRLQALLEAPDGGATLCAGGFNPFGRNALSTACANYLNVNAKLTTELKQQIMQAYATGKGFALPAGDTSFVIGTEYRLLRSDFDPGALSGPVSGFTNQSRSGGISRTLDFFGEAFVPLVRDAAFAQSLDLNLGYRLSRSNFEDRITGFESEDSDDSAYKAELSWQPLNAVRLRGSYQRAVRAPNFAELFDGGSAAPQYFDPCSVTSVARSGANASQLRSLCIATGLAPGAVDGFVQTPGSQVTINTRGSTALKPETADTFTLGFVFQPQAESRWAERLRTSVDWYSIDIADPIIAPNPNVITAACYNYYGTNPTYSASNPNCVGIVRSNDIVRINFPGGGLAFPTINAGKIKTSGVDLQVDYGFDLAWLGLSERAGSVAMNLLVSHTLEYLQQERPDTPVIDYAGSISYFGEGLGSSFPEWRATLQTQYKVGPFAVFLRGRYIDGQENRAARQFPGETSFTGVGSVTYWDVSAAWSFLDNSQIRVGLNNAFDKQPPTYAPNVQSGTDPSQYDVIGRRVFAQVNVRF